MPDFITPSWLQEQWDYVMSAPVVIISLLLLVVAATWWARGKYDDREIRALSREVQTLQSHNRALEFQLTEARNRTVDFDRKMAAFQSEVAELKQLVLARAKPEELQKSLSTVQRTANEAAVASDMVLVALKADVSDPPGT